MNTWIRTLLATTVAACSIGAAQAQTGGGAEGVSAGPASTRPSEELRGTDPTRGGASGAAGTGASGTGSDGMTEGERLYAERLAARSMAERRKPISQGQLSVPGQDRGGYIGAGDWQGNLLYDRTMR